jgi:hypothetical protein
MALTLTSVLTAEVFAAIAAELLLAVDDVHIYLESGPIDRALESPPPGASTVAFNKPVLPGSTYATFQETGRRLTEGTDVNAGSLAISLGATVLTIREYGGPHDGTNIVPFGITERMKLLAKHNLSELIGGFMRRDRVKFLNTTYRDLLLGTTNVVVASGAAEGAVVVSQGMTAVVMRALNKLAIDSKIPPYANGRWRFAINSKDMAALKADADVKAQLNFNAQDSANVRGYIGTWEGMDFITDTYMPTKGVGAGSAVTGYQGILWGPNGIGHEPVMNPEPRLDPSNDFGRRERMMWISYDAIGLLYPELVVRTITT